MDGMIEGFHDALGLSQGGRDEFPRDQFRVIFYRKDGTEFEMDGSDSGVGLEDLVLSAEFRLTGGGDLLPQTCLILHLKLPTGDQEDLYGSGSLDGGVALLFGKRIWRFYGYLTAQYTHFGEEELAGIPMRENQISLLMALEYPLSERLSIVLQELVNSGPARDFYQFSEPSHEITLGAKAELFSGTVFEIGVIENLFRFDNSPDFGIHFGISRMF